MTQSFYGTFDGQGHTIYGINISSNEDCFGLFRYAYGIIKRLTLADATVTGTSSVGGIAGLGPAKIEDCHVSGSIIGSSGNVGGIIAWAGSSAIIVENSYVKDCTFSGSVTGMQNVGGIVGYDQFSSSVYSYTIDNCTVTNSTLHGNNSVVGGIVGVIWTGNANTTTSRVKNCKLAQTTVTETNSGTEHGAIVGQMKYQAATVVSGCVYHSTDQSLTGIGSSSEGSNNDTGCSRVYSLNREVGITVSQVSGTTATIGGTAYYANGATITLGHNRPGQIFGNYVSSDVTITDDTFTMPAQDVSVSATWTTDPDFSGNNDESEYTINNATGWNNFCDLLAGGETFNGKTVKLGADIGTEQAPITRMAGPNQFCGNFNGGNHKLTFNYTASGNYSAPFASVKGGSTDATAITISNLNVVTTITATDYKHAAGLVALQQGHVNVTGCNATVNITSTKGTNTDLYPAGLVSQASSSNGGTLTVTGCTATGTISTDGKYAAGLVGILQGAATITDCVSSVTINSSTSGDGTHGGIVGSNTGAINIYGTVFNGRLLGTATECVGGFIGWRHGGANIYNSLFAPTEVTVKTDGSATFARNDVDTHNCYYTYYLCDGEHYVPYYATDGITRRNGYAARTVTAGENVTVAVSPVGSPVENGTYSVSGITAYAKGITRTVDDATTFYYGSGDAVSLTLQNTPPQGYALSGYEASKGTLTGTENPYTLTMPDEDVTVSATWTPSETLNLTANQAPDENYWTTFYCGDAGYTIDGGENACAYTATYSDGKLTLHNQGKEIPQGTAVIIVADNAEVSMTKANLSAFSGTNHLRGVDVDTPTDDIQTDLGSGTFYVLGMTNDHFGFHKYTGATMAARKAFVLVNGSNALARSLTVVFEDATGITTTNFTNGTNSDATWYNLDGRRLSGKPSQRGVYVNNGKKIVIK